MERAPEIEYSNLEKGTRSRSDVENRREGERRTIPRCYHIRDRI